jgi:hypothetical protein
MPDEEKSSPALAALRMAVPVRELTPVPVDEWAVRRMWEGIQRRERSRQLGRWKGSAWGRWPLASTLLGCSVVLLLALVAMQLVSQSRGDAVVPVAVVPVAAGPLLTREAQHFASIEGPLAGPPLRAEFADGSSIEVFPGARVDGLASSASEFVVLLRRGRARFLVQPGGPRRWLIETRNARVEVVGTVFSVDAGEGGADVQVEVGTVLVRSPVLPDGVQRLDAGQSLELRAPAPPPPAASAPHEAFPAPSPPVHARAPARGGKPRHASAAALWEGADAARRSGQPARAAALLELLMRDYPDDSQVAAAAFTRGVLQFAELGQPAGAASSFRQALDLGIGAALREDCYWRWARALERAGDGAGVRAAVAEYLRVYPNGRHRHTLQRLIEARAGGGGVNH